MLSIREFLRHFTKTQLLSALIGLFLISLAVLTPLIIKKNQDTRSDASSGTKTSQSAKNIVVFLVDDLDEESLDLMLKQGKLPNIKKYLIDAGTRFKNSFVTQSMCCPSRATLLTGKYSHNTKVFNVVGDESGASPEIYDDNLALWMKDKGYKTAYIGKYMNSGKYRYDQKFPGWDYWYRVSGFDTRPGRYKIYKNTEGGTSANLDTIQTEPDSYQTKYIGDESLAFIDAVKSEPFLLVNAPNAVHLEWPGNWSIVNDGKSVVIDPNNRNPMVAFNVFKHPNENVGIRQHAILGSGTNNYTIYYRDMNSNGTISAWINAGSAADNFAGTLELPIVAFNSFVHPATQKIRQQLIRGTTTDGYRIYHRDLPDVTWKDIGDDLANFRNTGSYPIVGFSSSNLTDGTIEQHLIRGSQEAPIEHYSRMITTNNTVTDWFKEGEFWDWGTGTGAIAGYDIRTLPNQKVQHILVRQSEDKIGYDFYYQQLNSFYNSSNSGSRQILGVNSSDSSEFPATRSVSIEEGEMFDKNMPKTTSTLPFGSFSGRVYADGNWPNRLPYQSYNPSLYPGGTLPAGTLRQDNAMQSTIPLAGYDLLSLNKPSFNSVNCTSNLAPGLCGVWPDVYSSVLGNKQQIDYIRRQHLDRLEALITVDVMVGEIMKKLESENLLTKTVVLFTSDNGYFNGEHRLGNKILHYEESLRVPLIIRNPDKLASKQNENTVANIDIAPTIMDFAGLQWDKQSYAVDGRSLRPLLESAKTLENNWRKYVLFEHRYPRNYAIQENWKWAWAIPDHSGLRIGLEAQSTEGKQSVFIRYTDDPLTRSTTDLLYEYFDLAKDGPHQTVNRYSSSTRNLPGYNPNLFTTFNTTLDQLGNCSGANCRTLDAVTTVNARISIPGSSGTPTPTPTPATKQKTPVKAQIKIIK